MVRAMIDALKEDRCPDCGGFIFRPGPQGGISQNIECVGCGNRFNVTRYYHTLDEILAGGERVVTHAERLEREDQGGGWWREDMFPKVLL
jgi:hypothetical protein